VEHSQSVVKYDITGLCFILTVSITKYHAVSINVNNTRRHTDFQKHFLKLESVLIKLLF